MTDSTIPAVASIPAAAATEPAPPPPVEIALEDGPATPAATSGDDWQASIVIDSEDRRVTLFRKLGPGWPVRVFNSIDLALSIPATVSLSHLRELLEGEQAQACLIRIVDSFEGCSWTGHATQGDWATDDEGSPVYAEELTSLGDLIEQAGLPCYSSAGQWLEPCWSEVREQVRKALYLAPETAQEGAALDRLAAQLVKEGEDAGALVEVSDVRRQLQSMAEALDSNDDDDDLKTLYLVTAGQGDQPPTSEEWDEEEPEGEAGRDWWLVEAWTPLGAVRQARDLVAPGAAASEVLALDGVWDCQGLQRLARKLRRSV